MGMGLIVKGEGALEIGVDKALEESKADTLGGLGRHLEEGIGKGLVVV
jgi:hypothetical protein